MTTLVLPIAGESKRHGNSPKWMLTHLNGDTMLKSAVSNIVMQVDRIIVAPLQRHLEENSQALSVLTDTIRSLGFPPEIYPIKETHNQPETVYLALQQAAYSGYPVEGNFIVKDCDNYFRIPMNTIYGNMVAYSTLGGNKDVVAHNKSYIQIDGIGNVSNIVEKRVISDNFNVGGYGFRDAELYGKAYRLMSAIRVREFNEPKENELEPSVTSLYGMKELHLSHLIYEAMIQLGEKFRAVECSHFLDWGTAEDWNKQIEKEKQNGT